MKKFVLSLVAAAALLHADDKPVRLADIRKIYIERMDNGLDQYLRAALAKKFHDRLRIVTERSEADAIMSSKSAGVQRVETGSVDLMDPAGKVVLWSGTAGDRNEKFLGLKHGGQQKVADKLAGDLKKAMQQ